MSARGRSHLGQKLFSNCCTLRFVESDLAVTSKFVMKRKDPRPGPNPASSKATDTPSTFLPANASGGLGYLILLASSRPNLNLFQKGKNNPAFVPVWFRTHTRTNR